MRRILHRACVVLVCLTTVYAISEFAFVHTFDTREACVSRCRKTCTSVHSDDLMMTRWQCPVQEEESQFEEESEESSIASYLIILIPATLFGSLLFLFLCISCVQRFFRTDY